MLRIVVVLCSVKGGNNTDCGLVCMLGRCYLVPIKRRIFISNIFMVIFSVGLAFGLMVVIHFAFDNLTGIDINEYHNDTPFNYIVILICVLVANFLFTRLFVKRIKTALNVLTNGVREIRDGNLNYRIEHTELDAEFNAVCADFNDMAGRLREMVEQRLADEKNRKELIAGISHDLRTPLATIKAYSEGLKKGVAANPEMQSKYIDTIQDNAEDLEYIINQLFLFSKIDIGEFPFKFDTVDIGNELEKIVATLTDEYREKGLEVSLKENTQNVFVSIDVVQFKTIIQNVLGNSVKYGKKDGGHSEISCRKQGDAVSIIIRDNGAGVPEKMLARIFDIFYRGDASRSSTGSGSGLGLAICSKIIERLNGTIKAENAQEGGFSIIISLPVQRGESE